MKNFGKALIIVLVFILSTSATNVLCQGINVAVNDQYSVPPIIGNTQYVAQWIVQDVNTFAYYTCNPNTVSWWYNNSCPATSFTTNNPLTPSSTYVLWVRVDRYDYGSLVATGQSRSSQFLGSSFPYIIFYMTVLVQ